MEAEWAAEGVWTFWRRRKKIFHLLGFEGRFHGRPAVGYPNLQETYVSFMEWSE